MNNAFRKEPDAEKPHVRNSVRDTFGNGCIYSTIDRQTLINAQKHPDEYRDLIVRVAGYSDHFRNLDKALQDEIIERTEQSFLLKNVREGSRQAAFSVIITKYEEVILMKKEYLYAGTSVLCFGTARLKAQTAFVINELWPALIILFSCWILKEKMNLGNTAVIANLAYLTPFVSLILTHFVLGEKITVFSVLGLLLIVTGIIIQMVVNKKMEVSEI